ncbi:MAG: hypothetical protein ACT4QE_24425 [Anaerolineales bacterium]
MSHSHETLLQASDSWTLSRNVEQLWTLQADGEALTVHYSASPGVLHYFRLADATLIPLPPEHAPTRHIIRQGRPQGSPLRFSAGDAYIAVSPGVARITDSPAVARFIHLRDYFNADKLAEALLAHLLELACTDQIPEDVTVLVVEAR